MIKVAVLLIQVVAAVVLRHLDMIRNGNINHQNQRRESIKEIRMMILLTKRVRIDLVIQSTVVNDTKEMNINERRRIKDLTDIDVRGVVVVVQMMIIVDIHQRRSGSMIDDSPVSKSR